MGYASGLHREALIATGVVLFVFILLLNFCVALLNRGKNHE
jgi:phosphate transport system permease protein